VFNLRVRSVLELRTGSLELLLKLLELLEFTEEEDVVDEEEDPEEFIVDEDDSAGTPLRVTWRHQMSRSPLSETTAR